MRGGNVKTFRWDHRLQIPNLFMALKRVTCRSAPFFAPSSLPPSTFPAPYEDDEGKPRPQRSRWQKHLFNFTVFIRILIRTPFCGSGRRPAPRAGSRASWAWRHECRRASDPVKKIAVVQNQTNTHTHTHTTKIKTKAERTITQGLKTMAQGLRKKEETKISTSFSVGFHNRYELLLNEGDR